MKSRWITYKGKRIFIADYSNLGMNLEALQAELNEVARTLAAEPVDSVLSLTDFRGSHTSPQALGLIKAALAKTNSHVHRRTIVGFSGVRKKMLEVMAAFTGKAGLMPFDTLEEAQAWLVK
jgi:hypothetical protein